MNEDNLFFTDSPLIRTSPDFKPPASADARHLEPANGDFAVIGEDIDELAAQLPPSASCGPDERMICVPQETLALAKTEIPDTLRSISIFGCLAVEFGTMGFTGWIAENWFVLPKAPASSAGLCSLGLPFPSGLFLRASGNKPF